MFCWRKKKAEFSRCYYHFPFPGLCSDNSVAPFSLSWKQGNVWATTLTCKLYSPQFFRNCLKSFANVSFPPLTGYVLRHDVLRLYLQGHPSPSLHHDSLDPLHWLPPFQVWYPESQLVVPLVEVAQHWAAGPRRVCMQIKLFVVNTSNSINIRNTQIYLIISKPNSVFPTQFYVLTFNKVTLPKEESQLP